MELPKPIVVLDGKVLLRADGSTLLAYNARTSVKLAEMKLDAEISSVVDAAGEVVTTSGHEVRQWDLQARSSVLFDGPTNNINGAQYVKAMQRLVTYGDDGEAFFFDAQGRGTRLDGPTKSIGRAEYVEAMQRLVTYGRGGEAFLFDAQGQGTKLDGPTDDIVGARYVEAMQRLVTYGYGGEAFLFDAQGRGTRLHGPTKGINGAKYLGATMQRLVTYGWGGEAFLFDLKGRGTKLDGPTENIIGAHYVEPMQRLVTYGRGGEAFWFDAQGQGTKLDGPTNDINGAHYVEAMQRLVTYGDDGEAFFFDAQGRGTRLDGPTENIGRAEYVEAMQRLVTYGWRGEAFLFDAQGQGTKLDGPTNDIVGARYVEAMQRLLVTYKMGGEAFLFDAQGRGTKLDGPTKVITGAEYVEAMQRLFTYWAGGEAFCFDAKGRATRLDGPTKGIRGGKYVEMMQGFVTYGAFGEAFLFDAKGRGTKLDGPTKVINGAHYVEAMQRLVTYGGTYGDRSEAFLFDAQGRGTKLDGPTEFIIGAHYVEAMQRLVTYGFKGEAFLFDAQGQGTKLDGPTEDIFRAQYMEAVQRLVTDGRGGEAFLFDAQGRGTKLLCGSGERFGKVWLGMVEFGDGFAIAKGPVLSVVTAPGEQMALEVEAPVQELVAMPSSEPGNVAKVLGATRNLEVLAMTGPGDRGTTLVNVSLCSRGFIAARPYHKAFSTNPLDVGKRFALELSVAGFFAQAASIAITLLQVLGAAYTDVSPPAKLRTPAKALHALQHMGLDATVLHIEGVDPDLAVFVVSFIVVWAMVATFMVQELVEFRKFMEPSNSLWPFLYDAASVVMKVVSGPLFLPLLQAVLLPVHQLVAGASNDGEETTLASIPLFAFSLLSASALALYALRFARVDKQLKRINANGWGLLSFRRDMPPTAEQRFRARTHPLSPKSPRHDLNTTLIKVLLTVVQVICSGVFGATLRFALSLLMACNDWCYDEFFPNSAVDYNALKTAGSAGVAWNTMAAVCAAIADSLGKLEDWDTALLLFNVFSIPAACATYYGRKIASNEKTVDQDQRQPMRNVEPLAEPLLP